MNETLRKKLRLAIGLYVNYGATINGVCTLAVILDRIEPLIDNEIELLVQNNEQLKRINTILHNQISSLKDEEQKIFIKTTCCAETYNHIFENPVIDGLPGNGTTNQKIMGK